MQHLGEMSYWPASFSRERKEREARERQEREKQAERERQRQEELRRQRDAVSNSDRFIKPAG